MEHAAASEMSIREQDRRVTETVAREERRLRNFIRRWVSDEADVQDIAQDVFYELIEAERVFTFTSVEHVGAWLIRVARNQIIDRFRKKKTDPMPEGIEDLLPSPEAGPDAVYARGLLLDEVDAALDELPEEQREVFLAHELEGLSFKEISARTGVGVNTLLSRKHYAVLHLRKRLRSIRDEWTGTGEKK